MNQVFQAVGNDVERRSVDGIFIARLGLDAFALQNIVYLFLDA